MTYGPWIALRSHSSMLIDRRSVKILGIKPTRRQLLQQPNEKQVVFACKKEYTLLQHLPYFLSHTVHHM